MNRSKKMHQMRKFILKYGVIDQEYKRPPDNSFPPYRKGSYFASFLSHQTPKYSISVGDVDKYHVYKFIIQEIKRINLTT